MNKIDSVANWTDQPSSILYAIEAAQDENLNTIQNLLQAMGDHMQTILGYPFTTTMEADEVEPACSGRVNYIARNEKTMANYLSLLHVMVTDLKKM